MSHDNEELIDYEDEHDVITNNAAPSASGATKAAHAGDGEGEKDKKNFSGIHSTGFRYYFLLDRVYCPFDACLLIAETSC